MSTKTSFKRIAAVAAVALTLGGLSAVSAHAAPQAETLSASALTATALPGADASVTITQTYLSTSPSDTITATATIVSMPAGNASLPTWSTGVTATVLDSGSPVKDYATALVASTGSVASGTYVKANHKLTLNTPTAGTYVVKVSPASTSVASSVTITFTIADTATAPTAKASRVYMQAGPLTAPGGGYCTTAGSLAREANGCANKLVTDAAGALFSTAGITNTALLASLGANIATQDASAANLTSLAVTGGAATAGTTVANFGVILGNGETITASTITGGRQCTPANYNGYVCSADFAPTSSTYFNVAGFPVTATVAGPGYISYANVVQGKSFTELSTSGDVNYLQKSFGLVSDGTTGTSTVTFTVGGLTLGTFKVNFSGAVASYSVAPKGTAAGTVTSSPSSLALGLTSDALEVTALDAAGNPVPSATIYAYDGTAATGTVATSASTGTSGVAKFAFTGSAAGTSVITFGNASTLAASTITKTQSVEVTKSTAKTVSLSLDQSSYEPGAKMILTISAVDSNGKPVSDGTKVLLSAISGNFALSNSTTLSAVTTLLGGKATQTLYAPVTPGTFTITGTEGSATDNVVAGGTAASITATATITNAAADSAQAAIDAAQEATDAANAAYDAANNAMDSADAATAAAQDASDNASAALAAVTSLSATVAKLVKSVTAIATALASIKKKLGVK